MLDVDLALQGQKLLGELCTPSEAEELAELARASKFQNVGYGYSVLSMAQSIANIPGQKEKLLLIARHSKDERDAKLELIGFVRDRFTVLQREVSRGRIEGDAKRQFREELLAFARRGWPLADLDTLYLTIGQSFKDTPGVWQFDFDCMVVALRNLRRFG